MSTATQNPSSNLLLIFLKEPIPGTVKTRLAKDCSEETACLYYRVMVQVLLQQLEGLKDTDVRFCYTPDDAGDAVAFWLLPQLRGNVSQSESHYTFTPEKSAPPLHITFYPQGSGNLGERMQRAFAEGFRDNYQKVAIIGSDCPDCGSRWVQTALTILKAENDCVIGPSPDGGYYLLAMQALHLALFTSIEWSSEQVLEQTLQASKQADLSTTLLPELKDIDHLEDWERALSSPIGGKLKAALKRLQNDHAS